MDLSVRFLFVPQKRILGYYLLGSQVGPASKELKTAAEAEKELAKSEVRLNY